MTILVYITHFLGNILLIGSAGAALAYLRVDQGNAQWLNGAYRSALVAMFALLATIVFRTVQWHLVPFTTAADSLCLLAFFSLLTILVQLGHDRSHRALLCFYLPPLALVAVLSMYMAVPALSTAPRPLSGALLTAHVGLVFLAFALFFVAGINSVAYAFQAQRLKHRLTTGLFQMLPSLESLDRDLFRLIKIGYPAFAITLVVGGFWVWYEGQNLSPTWWLSPKIFMAVAMLVFYAFTFHARAAGRLRGPKLAHIVCYGTGTLIGIYLVLALLNVLNYNFYGDAG
jgi:ABC-type uncharacterized transport system permease subunit